MIGEGSVGGGRGDGAGGCHVGSDLGVTPDKISSSAQRRKKVNGSQRGEDDEDDGEDDDDDSHSHIFTATPGSGPPATVTRHSPGRS